MSSYTINVCDESELYTADIVHKLYKYANFLEQILTLGMFVPCDLDGNVLEKPLHYDEWISEYKKGFIHEYDSKVMLEYQQAQGRVLFKFEAGFDSEDVVSALIEALHEGNLSDITIEDFVTFWHECDVELTPNAIKQLK